MNFKEYKEKARSTAIYPYMNTFDGFDYCASALCGEVGECFNVIKKCMRDDNWELTEEKKNKLIGELGGVSWYISQIFAELQLKAPFFEENIENLQKKLKKDTNFTNQRNKIKDIKHLLSVMLRLCADIMENTNFYENSVPEEQEKTRKDLPEKICNLTYNVMNGCIYICILLDIQYEDVLQKNLDVLNSRKQRGVLGGSGDDR